VAVLICLNPARLRWFRLVRPARRFSLPRMKISPALISACAFGLLAILPCNPSARAAGVEKGAADLAKQDEAWCNAVGKKDVDLIVSFYTDDAMIYSDHETVTTGRDAARKFWIDGFADPSFSVSWKVASAAVAKSGEMGYTTGNYVLAFKGPDGKPGGDKGKYITIWKKGADGKWLVAHDIYNSDLK
jgi:ketosteroid isomerase-like protein